MITTDKKYVVCGHAALPVQGSTIVDGPKKRVRLVSQKDALAYLDRPCGPQEFADISGLQVIHGIKPRHYKPRRVKVKAKPVKVYDLRLDKA